MDSSQQSHRALPPLRPARPASRYRLAAGAWTAISGFGGLALAGAILWAQSRLTRLEHDQIAAPPPVVSVTGIQITSRPDSEGGGELVFLHLSSGEVVGPFLKLASLPQGVGYGTTEVNPPSAPASPPCLRGHWARDATYFYMCLSEPAVSSGTRWRRLRWDPWP